VANAVVAGRASEVGVDMCPDLHAVVEA
jgi:hypothetical protein